MNPLACHRLPRISLPKLIRSASSASSRWKQRQGKDAYARDARVQGLKSRAAFKLLEMDSKFRLFKSNQTIVDLGYAPGSWSQVAVERTRPHGRVIGIDLIPAQPPRGVSTFQGDFLSPTVQSMVKDFITDSHKRKPPPSLSPEDEDPEEAAIEKPSYFDMERHASEAPEGEAVEVKETKKNADTSKGRLVDVVLSDMLMNTSGNAFRDHAGSMDLCYAALQFASDTLKSGGHFVCKFYQGAEDKDLEKQLKTMFAKVFREKPESSRKESKEAYFVALRKKGNVKLDS